ncbi:AbrB family transcriptional regulator [Desulfovibrio inopinatus]|uniref:AbrB family transcriptional regulator n=1 Tax=Desulfovibrio inopinatus TaxID=102109 RepID=UPI0003F4F38E|nr:AbrB family transcriptional regulator [Desulfovibrio inopinatus]
MTFNVPFLYCALAGIVGGLLGMRIKLPAASLFGACLGVIILKLLWRHPVIIPRPFDVGVQIVVGILIGASFSPELFQNFSKVAFLVLGTSIGLILSGACLAIIFVKMGLTDPATAVLATNPGALTGMIPLAREMGVDATVVFISHFVRLLLVLASAPVLLHFAMKWAR